MFLSWPLEYGLEKIPLVADNLLSKNIMYLLLLVTDIVFLSWPLEIFAPDQSYFG